MKTPKSLSFFVFCAISFVLAAGLLIGFDIKVGSSLSHAIEMFAFPAVVTLAVVGSIAWEDFRAWRAQRRQHSGQAD